MWRKIKHGKPFRTFKLKRTLLRHEKYSFRVLSLNEDSFIKDGSTTTIIQS